MNGEVVALRGIAGASIPQRPEDVRELIEGLVASLEAGEISGIAVTYVSPGGSVQTDWASGSAAENLMVAGASRLAFRVLQAATAE